MALIACRDCGTEVSDQAAACPKCARPIAGVAPAAARSAFSLGRVFALLLFLAFAGWAVLAAVSAYQRNQAGPSLAGTPRQPDVMHTAKETAAEAFGIKTAHQGAEQRKREADTAIQGSNRILEEWNAIRLGDSFPAVQEAEAVRRRLLDALTLAKTKSRAYVDYCQQNRDDLVGFNLDTATLNVPKLDALENSLKATLVRTGRVAARSDWTPLGVSVETGWRVTAWARGQWKAGPKWRPCGPGGTTERSTFGDFRAFAGDIKLMALMIRTSGQPNRAVAADEARTNFRAEAAGALEGKCNDQDTSNNDGEMEVLVIAGPE